MAVSQSLTLTQSSQSVEGNYSKVRILWTSTQSGSSWNGYTRTAYYYVSINGGAEATYSVSYTLPQNTTKTIIDTTITVPHRADGTGSVSVRTWMDTDISAGVIQKSQSLTLTTIPRATTPTFSASSVNMGSAVTINLNRASSSFTHKLKYAFGSLSNQTSGLGASSGVGTSTTFTPPLTLANQIPKATSGKCTITCETYNGTTLIGTKTATLTLNVPSSVVPTINNVSISEATAGIATKFAAYVQSKSTLAVAITASGSYGSTIANYETYIQAVAYREASFTSNIITASGTIGVVTTVTDSRGRTAQVSNSVTVLAYSPPEISALSAYRITTAGVASDEGNRIAMTMKFAISSVGGHNDHTYNFKYRKSTDESFTSFGSGSASWTYDSTQYFTSSPNISPDYAYVIRLEIADYFQTVAYEVQIPTAFTIMDFRNTGKGMAIGKVSEKDALEVAMNSEFTGQVKIFAPDSDVADSGLIRMYRSDGTLLAFLATSDNGDGLNLHLYQDGAWSGAVKIDSSGGLNIKGKSLLDMIYPVGSVYMSVNNVSPQIFFGGTWERIKDRFLLSAGDTYGAGDTGGEATHTLTENEMPRHRHRFARQQWFGSDSVYENNVGAIYSWKSGEGTGGSTSKAYIANDSRNDGYTGGDAPHNNMPPYLTVYMWKRIA